MIKLQQAVGEINMWATKTDAEHQADYRIIESLLTRYEAVYTARRKQIQGVVDMDDGKVGYKAEERMHGNTPPRPQVPLTNPTASNQGSGPTVGVTPTRGATSTRRATSTRGATRSSTAGPVRAVYKVHNRDPTMQTSIEGRPSSSSSDGSDTKPYTKEERRRANNLPNNPDVRARPHVGPEEDGTEDQGEYSNDPPEDYPEEPDSSPIRDDC
jgi:hypothetical protein